MGYIHCIHLLLFVVGYNFSDIVLNLWDVILLIFLIFQLFKIMVLTVGKVFVWLFNTF